MAHVPAKAKSNETTGTTRLFRFTDVTGAVITVDAIDAVVDIVKAITTDGGDVSNYLKRNQGTLHKAVTEFVQKQRDNDVSGLVHKTRQTIPTIDTTGGRNREAFIQFKIREAPLSWRNGSVKTLPELRRGKPTLPVGT